MRLRLVYRDAFALVPGGIERHVRDLAQALSSQVDVEVIVAARRLRRRQWDEGRVPVRAVGELARIGGVPLSPWLPVSALGVGCDVVHLHGPNPAAEVAVPLARAATVVTWHCDPFRLRFAQPSYVRMVVATLARSHRVLVSSHRLLDRSPVLARLVERQPDLVRVVPFGVDLERFSPGPTPREPVPVVLFVGRLRPYKGLDVLVRALREVQAVLLVAGDGPLRGALASLGSELLGDRLRLLGDVPEASLPELYRRADVVCLPSISSAEAFGMVLLEAMACGVPVVSTEVGTATSLVNRQGETGLVVPPNDVPALASALTAILSDPERAAAMGEAGRRHVARHHDLRAMAQRTLEVYEEVVDQAAPARRGQARPSGMAVSGGARPRRRRSSPARSDRR